MDAAEYINSVVGKPYKKGADGDDAFDCWGLVVHSFKHVEGIDLPSVVDRESCDLDGSAAYCIDKYEVCEANEATIFCVYDVNAQMTHIGRVMLGKVLHCFDSPNGKGCVQTWPMRLAEKLYGREGAVIYMRYKG